MDRSRVALIIPAFNEEGAIQNVIKNVIGFGRLIVVDDGSTDKTAKYAEQEGAWVISHQKNLGYEAALNSGFHLANQWDIDYVITLDGDGQHNSHEIPRVVNELMRGVDLIVCGRKKTQRISEKIFSIISLFLYKIKDPLSGFKGYKISVYRDRGIFDINKSVGTELLFWALKNGYLVNEMIIDTKKRNGESRFGGGLKANLRIIRALKNIWFI